MPLDRLLRWVQLAEELLLAGIVPGGVEACIGEESYADRELIGCLKPLKRCVGLPGQRIRPALWPQRFKVLVNQRRKTVQT